MRKIIISDATMKQPNENLKLSFKEKIELSKLLDKLGIDVIELDVIKNHRVDALQVKSIATAVTNCTIAVPIDLLNYSSIEKTWAVLKNAKKPRLQIYAPTSDVQIEYLYHKNTEVENGNIWRLR